MKGRTFSLAVALLLCATMASAQLKWGVKGGLNITDMKLRSSTLNVDNRTGYFFGPTAKLTIPVLGLGLDGAVLFDQRKGTLIDKTNAETTDLKLQQLVVPLNVRYTIGLSSVLGAFVYAGPQYAYNIGGKHQGNWEWKDATKSANIGGGLMVLDHLQLHVNYNFQFDRSGEDHLFGVGKEHTWQIGGAYYF